MFLETIDFKKNNILIYSKNQFDFNNNFKIIYKNQKIKRPYSISYIDVCNYIKDPAPKNLIVYRLLTNVHNLQAYSTKYGYFINIENNIELIYFDPVFAIKDLYHLKFDFDPERFRFKIQQIGLTSMTMWDKEPNFAEVYSFDLKAIEAQNQNDKIFADAIFALDPSYIDEENFNIENDNDKNELNLLTEEKYERKLENFNKPSTPSQAQIQNVREETIKLLKKALLINESQNIINIDVDKDGKSESIINLMDLFKKTYNSEHLEKRKKENIILRFNKNALS
ncbi:MAG: hypothetical protein N2249_01950 [Melioribacter sp.]|nr:hypothetical protein [Melioribacter sp.]